jgi:hypothetical protein
MKKTLAIIAILCLPALAIAQDDCTYKIADDDSLKTALNNFHEVMGDLWHGPVEEGNMEPVKAKMDVMKSLCEKILAANLPTEFEFRCATVSAAATAFSKSVEDLAVTLEGGDAEKSKEAFSAMHDAYREIRTLTTSATAYMDKFHEAMHPLWHEAYEAKDVEAIKKGVPELEMYAGAILKANKGKPGETEAQTKALVDAVAKLKKCCEGDDGEAILTAMKEMHEAYHVLSGEE